MLPTQEVDEKVVKLFVIYLTVVFYIFCRIEMSNINFSHSL